MVMVITYHMMDKSISNYTNLAMSSSDKMNKLISNLHTIAIGRWKGQEVPSATKNSCMLINNVLNLKADESHRQRGLFQVGERRLHLVGP